MIRRIFALVCLLLMLFPGASAEPADELWNRLPVAELEERAQEAGVSFAGIAKQLLTGESISPEEWLHDVTEAARSELAKHWFALMAILVSVCICELVRALTGCRGGTLRALELLCHMTISLILFGIWQEAAQETARICEQMRAFTGTAAPLLVAALTLTGSAGMSAAMPAMAVMADQAAVYITTDIGLPMLGCACLLALFSGLGSHFRLERLFKLCIGAVKWLLGGCMTGFLGLMSAQTILVGSRDGIAVRTARFAVDNLLPVIGGELADTVSGVFASAVLVKNAAGVAVCASLIAMAIVPAIRLAVLALMMKISSAAAEMLGAQHAAVTLERFAQVLDVLLAVLAAVSALGMILAGAAILAAGGKG